MWKQTALLIGVAVALLTTASVRAHHSVIAEFDLTKSITLRGTLAMMEWVNSHGSIHLDVKGPDGRTVRWQIEIGSPARMAKRGLKKTDFRVGEDLIIGGFAAKDRSRQAVGWIITCPARESAYPSEEASFPPGR